MKNYKFLFLFLLSLLTISCEIPDNKVKKRATEILNKTKIEIDSTINSVDSIVNIKVESTLNKVDTLLNH